MVRNNVVESLWSVLLYPWGQLIPYLPDTHQGRPSLSFTGASAFSLPFALAPAMRADMALKGLAGVGATDVVGSSTSIGSLMVILVCWRRVLTGLLLPGRRNDEVNETRLNACTSYIIGAQTTWWCNGTLPGNRRPKS